MKAEEIKGLDNALAYINDSESLPRGHYLQFFYDISAKMISVHENADGNSHVESCDPDVIGLVMPEKPCTAEDIIAVIEAELEFYKSELELYENL